MLRRISWRGGIGARTPGLDRQAIVAAAHDHADFDLRETALFGLTVSSGDLGRTWFRGLRDNIDDLEFAKPRIVTEDFERWRESFRMRRIGVVIGVSDVVHGAIVRHELEHQRQFAIGEVEMYNDQMDLAEKAYSLGIGYNDQPWETSANRAASQFVCLLLLRPTLQELKDHPHLLASAGDPYSHDELVRLMDELSDRKDRNEGT